MMEAARLAGVPAARETDLSGGAKYAGKSPPVHPRGGPAGLHEHECGTILQAC